MQQIAAVIVAAGRGERAGGGTPKQYRKIAGAPLLTWTLRRLAAIDGVGPIQIVIDPDHRALYERATRSFDLLPACPGGTTRQGSVLRGLEALAAHDPGWVMVHDAARPFVTSALVERLRDALATGADGVIPVLPVTDTLKRCPDGIIAATLDRSEFGLAQTPQAFGFAALLEAHHKVQGNELTDDAAVAEAAGMAVHTVPGDTGNVKVTMADDLDAATARLEHIETRTGTGFDVHAFAEGDNVMLCGIRIPHDQTLSGDTDADVGLHVLVDAMLGAMGEGDLGVHFPVGSAEWKGRPSSDMVAVAVGLMQQRHARLVHADITLIAQKPRLAKHQTAMKARVAELLGVAPSRVNIKVTSTDGLGFAGRSEGIAGQAAVTIAMPSHDPQ
ncbi:MAG: 2-C-methyl-D-erythritol 4-phosphate cytidylyltransferase [Rhodospirillales bacterium]|nr:2-C-methyl-D-erythritol 4-phosphate cytidylyltransferase [Rhodospirillales bacterium]